MSLFLSQSHLNKMEAAVHRLSDTYAWHRAVWKCFPGMADKSRNFLFRWDEAPLGFRLLLLSHGKPSPPDWLKMETREIHPAFLDFSLYRFQLKANPTLRRKSDRRRVGIYQADDLNAWLEKKAEANGFHLPSPPEINGPTDSVFFKKGKPGKHTWTDFKGILEVRNPDRFKAAFSTGIGSAKSFGYGMLMLQPISQTP